jgi:hypothetical protein
MVKINTKINKINKTKNKNRIKKLTKYSYKIRHYSKKHINNEKYDNRYRILTLKDINKRELQNNLKIIVSKNFKAPLIGYLSIETIKKLLNSKNTFFTF